MAPNETTKLSPRELAKWQAEIDRVWEQQILRKELAREEAEKRSFNKAPGDPDWE
jgi:hypothetical protein